MRIANVVACLLVIPMWCFGEDKVNFNRDVRPILSDRCFQCHGPDEEERQAELRLDQADGPEGAYRGDEAPAIKPGSPEESALWQRITADDEGEVMPPVDSSKPPLTDDEKAVIRAWIEQGAPYAKFWAFQAPGIPPLPKITDRSWSEQPVDQFVLRRLEQENLTPSPRADRRTRIRRLSLDLIGLPPNRKEIHDYLNDKLPGAYERLVDRLLAKPQFGEHMAKYWLDLVRFADTNGIHHDHYREMTPYRDWVIRALNQNLPYDDFVKYQIAGDVYPDPTRDQLIASGFNRLHLIIDRGTALPEESFTRNVIDRVTAVGTAFMGVTVQCCVCHDHKYDPLTMKDFYQLFAFFNNLDADPETGGRSGTDFERGLQPPYIYLSDRQQQSRLDEFQIKIEQTQKSVQDLQGQLERAEQDGDADALQESIKRAQDRLKQLSDERDTFAATIPVAMVMKEKAERRPAHILIRGAYDNPGERVERGTPAFLPPMRHNGPTPTRLDLAEWLASKENPLTARVAVNRFWQHLFGVGIVKTSEDFGAQGEWPSHPELLDYLAADFVQSGWNVKAIMKQIVMSETYQQSSRATPEQFESDPENRLLARGSRFRLDSEVIRDQLLSTSGLLNASLFGKSVKPPQPKGLWESVSMPSSYPRKYDPDTGAKIYRRSVYTFWKRGMPPPQMTILNAPTREACIARRERTNTPLQALLLMNEPQYIHAARHLAVSTLSDRSLNSTDRVHIVYETITSMLPDANELDSLVSMVEQLESMYRDDASLADALCNQVQPPDGVTSAELAAWTMLINTIYNLDITKTRS